MIKRTNRKNNKRLLLSVLATILVLVVLAYLEKSGTINLFGARKAQTGANTEVSNNSVQIEEEKSAGDRQKDKIIEVIEPGQDTSEGVVITDAGQYGNIIEVRSFMPKIFEDGTCSIIFSKGSLSIHESIPGYKDSSTTICTNLEIERERFAESGTWTIQVSFKSASYDAVSKTKTINID